MRRSTSAIVLMLALACSQEEASKPSSPTPPEQVEPQPEPKQPEQPEQPEPTQPEPVAAKDGFFMAEGAPEPRACKLADDCLGNTIPDLKNPCCQNPRRLEPHARAYSKWVQSWRRDHCEGVTCPPPPLPSLPPDCAFKVECVEGRCVDTCP